MTQDPQKQHKVINLSSRVAVTHSNQTMGSKTCKSQSQFRSKPQKYKGESFIPPEACKDDESTRYPSSSHNNPQG